MVDAAELLGIEVLWDLFHYGVPDHIDQASADFPARLADFASSAVNVFASHTGKAPTICPINEISFLSWATEVGYLPGRNDEPIGTFKRRLAIAAVEAVRAMRVTEPQCRFVWSEPLIHVAARSHLREEKQAANAMRLAQFEAYDWILGRDANEFDGNATYADAIGLNFYPHNQWYFNGPTIPMGHHEFRPLRDMLLEVWERYRMPMFISETGAEGTARPSWFHYVVNEVRSAIDEGVQIEGICLYPITAYPGWDNSRHAEAGLFSSITADGTRHVYQPLLQELERAKMAYSMITAPHERGGAEDLYRIPGSGRY
jgi:beta-glucosidase/6-phospho-beta-glucosidase/beta-galactosidase